MTAGEGHGSSQLFKGKDLCLFWVDRNIAEKKRTQSSTQTRASSTSVANQMTAFSFNAFPTLSSSTLQAKPQCTSRCFPGDSGIKTIYIASSSGPWFGLRKNKQDRKLGQFSFAAESNQVATNSTEQKSGNADDQLSTAKPTTIDSPSNGISNSVKTELGTQTRDASNGVVSPSDVKVDAVSSPKTLKRSSLTAREKLRAARVLNRPAAPRKSEFGSKVLDALRESERGKKRSRLPEAPTNLLDDSKRGMPKQGLTFDFPGGFDLFVIVLSFVLITATMLITTYVVWKLGAIHFNDN